MKFTIPMLVFVLAAWSVARVLIPDDPAQWSTNTSQTNPGDSTSPAVGFPTFNTSLTDSIKFKPGNLTTCNGLEGCFRAFVEVVFNIGAAIVWFVFFVVEIIRYVVELAVFLVQATFTPIDGAPWWANGLIIATLASGIGTVIFLMARSGKGSA